MSILEGFGPPVEEINEKDFEEKLKKISPFDYVQAINYTKEDMILDERTEKEYNAFIINRAMGYSPDTVIAGNEVNSRPHLDKKLQYDFLLGIVSKRKRYNKWLKPEKEEKLEVIKEYYGYNNTKAAEALRLLTDEQYDAIQKRLNKGGKT